MRKIIAAAALAIASVSTANAAVFDFSYTATNGITFQVITAQGQVTATDTGGYGLFSVDNVTGIRNGMAITGYNYDDLTPQWFTFVNGYVSDVDFSYYVGADNYEITFDGGGAFYGTEYLLGPPGGDTSLFVTNFSLTPAAAAVPEPATWALMIVGFGGVGFGMRHRRKVDSRVPYTA